MASFAIEVNKYSSGALLFCMLIEARFLHPAFVYTSLGNYANVETASAFEMNNLRLSLTKD